MNWAQLWFWLVIYPEHQSLYTLPIIPLSLTFYPLNILNLCSEVPFKFAGISITLKAYRHNQRTLSLGLVTFHYKDCFSMYSNQFPKNFEAFPCGWEKVLIQAMLSTGPVSFYTLGCLRGLFCLFLFWPQILFSQAYNHDDWVHFYKSLCLWSSLSSIPMNSILVLFFPQQRVVISVGLPALSRFRLHWPWPKNSNQGDTVIVTLTMFASCLSEIIILCWQIPINLETVS